MQGVTDSTFSGSYIRKVWMLITFLIYFRFPFNQDFLTSAGNLVTSAKFMVSGMKCDTSDNDSPKVGSELFNSFTPALNNLWKPLPILFY